MNPNIMKASHVVSFPKADFNLESISEKLQNLVQNVKCCHKSCTRSAFAVNEKTNDLRCKLHIPTSKEHKAGYKKLNHLWSDIDQRLKVVEEDIIKSKLLYSFAHSDGLRDKMYTVDLVEADYEELRTKVEGIKALSDKELNTVHYTDFQYLYNSCDRISDLVDQIFKNVGSSFMSALTEKMLSQIIKKARGESSATIDSNQISSIPSEIYDKEYSFVNTFGEISDPNLSRTKIDSNQKESSPKMKVKNYTFKVTDEQNCKVDEFTATQIELENKKEKVESLEHEANKNDSMLQKYKRKLKQVKKMYLKEREKVAKLEKAKGCAQPPPLPPPFPKKKFSNDQINPLLATLRQQPLEGEKICKDTYLEIHADFPTDIEFMKKTKKCLFPEIKKLEINNIRFIREKEDIDDMNEFLSKAFTEPMKYLYLSNADGLSMPGDFTTISEFKQGILKICKLVTHQVFLSGFWIDNNTLKEIIECCHQVDSLVLDDCKVDLYEDFELNPDIDYKIKTLDLYRTARMYDVEFLDDTKLEILATEMARTKLRDSLHHIHVKESKFPGADAQRIFDRYMFKALVEGDEHIIDSQSD